MLSPGFGAGLGGGFFRFTNGLCTAGAESVEAIVGRKPFGLGSGGAVSVEAMVGRKPFALGNGGAAPGGGGGAAAGGGRGAEGLLVSESEYEDCSSAPVETPPLVFFSLGMPAANKPPSCGADSIAAAAAATPASPLRPVSLLLLFLFAGGIGGASPAGGRIPGTGGAPAIGAAPEPAFLSTMGADLSLVWTDFSFFPLLMSPSSAPCRMVSA